jgi:hypothetical protein
MTIPAIALLGMTTGAVAIAIDCSLVAADETRADTERRSAGKAAMFMAIAAGVLGTLVWLNL